MSEIELEAPPLPVALVSGLSYGDTEVKTFRLRCHDNWFQRATVLDETDTEILYLKSEPGKSWSLRRSLYDANDQHLLDFRHYSLDFKNRWTIEDPNGKELASIEHVKQITTKHSDVDMTINGTGDEKSSVVQMRQQDRSALTTLVSVQGWTVAEISMTARNIIAFNEGRRVDSSVWKIRLAPKMDFLTRWHTSGVSSSRRDPFEHSIKLWLQLPSGFEQLQSKYDNQNDSRASCEDPSARPHIGI